MRRSNEFRCGVFGNWPHIVHRADKDGRKMIDAGGHATSGPPREIVLSKAAVICDAETSAAAARQLRDERTNGAHGELRSLRRADVRLRRIAAEISRSVQARLPGRVSNLAVRVENDQFVLSGVSSSYYVKQVAQHVAMTALDALMLGRLVNEIEVRSVR
jgi:hypothetical protein